MKNALAFLAVLSAAAAVLPLSASTRSPLVLFGALPSNKPYWVKTIAPESDVGLNFARWE